MTKEKIKNEKFYSYLLMLCNFYFQSEILNCEKIEESDRVVYYDFEKRYDFDLVLKEKKEKKKCKICFLFIIIYYLKYF